MKNLSPPWKSATYVLVLLLLGGSYVNCEEWCYDKPSCGPNTWHTRGQCNGSKQSPINIDTKTAKLGTHLGPISFTGYEDRLLPQTLVNTGYFAEVVMKSGAAIFGRGLPGTYYLKSFHFHWNKDNSPGSEHAINGKRYDIELHIVHTKNNMSDEEAKKDPEGYAVLAFFLQKSNNAPKISSWKTLTDLFTSIPEKGNSVSLKGDFSLGGLLKSADVSTYYTYRGSLTTPPCSESVVWIVFPDSIEVTHETVKKFTQSLYFTTKKEGRRMQNNYRPLQQFKNRDLFYFSESKSNNPTSF